MHSYLDRPAEIFRSFESLDADAKYDLGFELLARTFKIGIFQEVSREIGADLSVDQVAYLVLLLSRSVPRLFEAVTNIAATGDHDDLFKRLQNDILNDGRADSRIVAAAIGALFDDYDSSELYRRLKVKCDGKPYFFVGSVPLSMTRISRSALDLGVVAPVIKPRQGKYRRLA